MVEIVPADKVSITDILGHLLFRSQHHRLHPRFDHVILVLPRLMSLLISESALR